MLSVMIYEPNMQARTQLLKSLQDQAEGARMLRICASTGSADDLQRYITSESGIMLVILGLGRAPVDNRARCYALAQQVMQQNRDNYTLFCVHSPEDLGELLQNCMRPAGILLPPFDEGQLAASLRRITDDYIAMGGEAEEQDFLMVESGASAYRIPYGQILYLEALDKKLNICTQRQVITVRKTLGSFSDSLPPRFLRCHRSYIVNSDCIDRASFADMTLTLSNGDVLPIARSSKDALREFMDRKKEAPQ